MSESESAADSHTIAFAEGWRIWKCAQLRGAGFPAELVLRLAAPQSSDCSSALLDLEQQFAKVVETVRQSLISASGDKIFMKARGKALAKLRQDKVPSNIGELGVAGDLVAPLVALEQKLAITRQSLAASFDREVALVSHVLAEVAADPRFVEAIYWQNASAAKLVLPRVLAAPAQPNSAQRQSQSLIAGYLQRYCTKNDTIGFFGPVAWATLHDGPSMRIQPGGQLLRRRRVYFEHWPMEAIASHFGEHPEIRPDLRPRLLPTVRLEGRSLHYGVKKSVEVSAEVASVLEHCDGRRSARSIASETLAAGSTSFEDADDIYDLLEELADKGLLSWTLELPSGVMGPDQVLRRMLGELPDSTVSRQAIGVLDALEAARERVEAAAGDARALRAELDTLNGVLTEHVAVAEDRGAGKMYAARTPVYEDCLRDVDLQLGKPFTSKLAAPLGLFLGSARWYTSEIAAAYRKLAEQKYSELTPAGGPLSYMEFWKALSPDFPKSAAVKSEPVARVQARLVDTWCRVLGLSEGMSERSLTRTSAELRERVAGSFRASKPGWPSARHMSPDIMLAAAGPAAFAAGEFSGVLGEIHIGNTLPVPYALQQHPDPEAMIRWRAADLGEIGISPVQPKEFVTRVDRVSYSPEDLSLEVNPSRSWRSEDQVMRVAELVVERSDGGLRVRSCRTGRCLDIITMLDQYITFASSSNFTWAPNWAHVPRVSIDSLVVIRETWRMDAAKLDFSQQAAGAGQFHSCRSWAQRHGLPRLVFFKIPEEPKPVFLDFDSPILVGRACTILKKASRVTLSEMLPGFDQLWLSDEAGKTYTSELRCVLVDPEHWSGFTGEPSAER